MKSEEFFREVDEELARDRLAGLWRRYGALLVAAAVLLVLGTAALVGWRAWEQRRLEAEAERFGQVVERAATEPAAAAEGLASFAAAEAGTGYAALARLREAAAQAAAGNEPGATAALRTLAAGGADDPIFRDLAGVLAAARELETADPAALRDRLEPLTAAEAPFRHTARELLALLQLRTGDEAGARAALETLAKEAEVPPAQARRVGEILASLGVVPTAAEGGTAAVPSPTPAAGSGGS